jgi:hypothetical protein
MTGAEEGGIGRLCSLISEEFLTLRKSAFLIHFQNDFSRLFLKSQKLPDLNEYFKTTFAREKCGKKEV